MPIPPQPLPTIPSAEDLPGLADELIASYKQSHESIIATIHPSAATFTNAIKPLVNHTNSISGTLAVISCLTYAGRDKATRDAARDASRRFYKEVGTMLTRGDFFRVIKAVHDREFSPPPHHHYHYERRAFESESESESEAPPPALDNESRKLLRELLGDFTSSGHGVFSSPEQFAELRGKGDEISELCREFNRNITDDEDGIWFSLGELEGVDRDVVASFASRDEGGDDGDDDKGEKKDGMKAFFVPFKKTQYEPVMRSASRAATRKRLYLAKRQSLGKNVPIFDKVVRLRHEYAEMLGYKNHAAYMLEGRMAGSPEWVERFLQSVRDGIDVPARKDMEHLLAMKRRDVASRGESGGDDDDGTGQIFPWDRSYYSRMASEERSIDHDKISEFFPLEYTVEAMLRLFTAFLGIVFVPVAKEELDGHIWHEDVGVYSVWEGDDRTGDSAGEFVGYLYTDLVVRDGKYHGNQNVGLQSGYERPDGSRVFPATTLMCAFPQPVSSGGCPLLRHSEVITLFHELGHGIHDLLSRTKYTRFHSYNGPARDFGEAPSMFLENFCWLKDELREMSCHYTRLGNPRYVSAWQARNPDASLPPEKILEQMLDDLIASRYIGSGTMQAYQLAVSLFDMRIHNPPSLEALLSLDAATLFQDLEEEMSHFREPDGVGTRGNSHVQFNHLLHGYSAGYYSYLWGSVYAADVFDTGFARDPRDKTVWERYRRIILEPGGSSDELKMVEDFLGRPVNPEALLRRLSGGT